MSSWYRTIDAGLWGDEKFRELSRPQPSAQFLWIYLLTGGHTEGLPGLYTVGPAALAEALRWPVEELRRALAELTTLSMALVDEDARVIYLPNAIKYQSPCNPSHLQGWGKAFRRIPECDLKTKWLEKVYEFAQAKGIPYVEAYEKTFETVWYTVSDTVSPPNPHPNPNSHPNTFSELSGTPDDAGSSGEDIPYAEIIDYLNERSGKRFRHGTDSTKRLIRARWNEGNRLDDFKSVIDTICREWLGTDQEMYIRPQTLFGTKFESYLNSQATLSTPQRSRYRDLEDDEHGCASGSDDDESA